jgi:hypothetical protein
MPPEGYNMVREAGTKGIAAERTIPEGKGGEFVSRSVSDTGAGVSAEVPAQIRFSPPGGMAELLRTIQRVFTQSQLT